MAVIETPPETVAAASEQAPTTPRAQAGGLAGVLGSGDHKVIGRLYIVTSLLFGLGVIVLGALMALEGIKPATLDVFSKDTVFQAFTLFRFGTLFLLFLNTGPLNAAIANVLPAGLRARGFAITTMVMHLLGDALSPWLIGVASDRVGLTVPTVCTGVLLALSGVVLLTGRGALERDLSRARGA